MLYGLEKGSDEQLLLSLPFLCVSMGKNYYCKSITNQKNAKNNSNTKLNVY